MGGRSQRVLNDILRDEWGFKGVTLTDAVMANRNWMDVGIGIEAGNDTWLSSGDWLVSKIEGWAKADGKFMRNLRASCKNFLYAYVNSTAINGMSSTDKVVQIMPAWEKALVSADVIIGIFAVAACALFVLSTLKDFKFGKE